LPVIDVELRGLGSGVGVELQIYRVSIFQAAKNGEVTQASKGEVSEKNGVSHTENRLTKYRPRKV
jgi:hypothetical protein